MYRFYWFIKLVHNAPTNQNEALFPQPIKQTRNLAHVTFPALFHRLHAIAVSANFFLEAISTTANIFSYITVYFKLRCIKPSRSGQSGQSWMKLLLMTQKTMHISNQKHDSTSTNYKKIESVKSTGRYTAVFKYGKTNSSQFKSQLLSLVLRHSDWLKSVRFLAN